MDVPALLQVGPELGVVVLVVVLLAVVLVSVFWIGVSYWVYMDAHKRGMDNATMWAVLVFVIGGLPGLVVYFLVRD